MLALLYFRRRALLQARPAGMILLVTVMILSPGALSSVADQFTRSDATAVPTVSDRASDYDAIRPDVWSHLAFGRGWGSYNHESYRILDSEILHRTIETGVLGLARVPADPARRARDARDVRSRSPRSDGRAQSRLIGAAIAVAFFVLALLFDVLSFPHVPYVFLYMTGLVAVVHRGARSGARRTGAPLPVAPSAIRREPARPAAKELAGAGALNGHGRVGGERDADGRHRAR